MPKVRLDWNELLLDYGAATTGFSVEMHLRTAPGATPAIAKFSTTAGTMAVAQPADSGATYGISVTATAAQMAFAAGVYFLDIVRTDGGLKTDLLDGDIVEWAFIAPVTEPGVA